MMSLDKFVSIISILAIVQSVNCDHKLYIVKKSGSKSYDTALLVTWDETEDEINAECDIISGRDRIKNALKSASYPSVETITDDELQDYLQDCDTVNEIQYEECREVRKASKTKTSKSSSSQTTTPSYDGIPVIFPGTKWCGAGDRAKHYDDLGLHQDTDRCCRAHDLCNDTLAPGETKNGLTNTSPFTKLSCQCDEDFYNCLDRINSVISNTIGNMYFNILKRECFKKDYPDSKKCKKYRTLSCQCDEDFCNCLDRINSVTSNTIGNMYFNILKRECFKKDYPDSKQCKKYRILSCQCDEDFYNCLDRINSVTSTTIGNMYFNILKRECFKKDYPDSKKCKKYRILSCQCDEDFYNCLDRINSVTSNTIGNMYVNILKRECYTKDYLDSKKCKKYRTIFKLECIEYEKNTKAAKVYKWVPAKKYKKIPFRGPITVTLPDIIPF